MNSKFKLIGLTTVLVFVVGILVSVLEQQWHRIHTNTSHLIGTVYEINEQSRSFVFAEYQGGSGFEEYYVDGDMPIVKGKCLDIEYTPKILAGFFWSSDEHQIRIVKAFTSDASSC